MARGFFTVFLLLGTTIMWAQEDTLYQRYDSLFQTGVEQLGYSGEASLKTSRFYLQIAQKAKDSLEIPYALDNIGSAHYTLNKLDSALHYYQRARIYFEANDDSIGLSKVLENIGVCYAYLSNIEGAVEAYREAYRIDTALGDREAEHYLLSNLASLYLMQENYPQAQKVLDRFLEISLKDSAFHFHLPYIYLDLSELLMARENYQAAEDTLLAAKALLDSNLDKGSYAMVYTGLGEVLLHRDQYDSALFYFKKALEMDSLLGDPYLIAYDLEYLARAEQGRDQKDQAERYLLQAKTIADSERVLTLSRYIYKALSDFYAKQGSFDRAWTFMKQHKTFADSVRNENAQTLILELEAQTAANRLQESALEAKVQEKKLQAQRRWILLFLFVFLAGLAIIYLQYRLRRKVSRSNQLLQKRNKEIADQQRILDQQARDLEQTNEQLKKMNESKDRLFSVLAHDLRQPFHQILSVIDLLEQQEIDEGDREKLFSELKVSVESTNDLVNNMLIWSKAQFAGISINKKELNLAAAVKKQFLQLSVTLEKKKIRVKEEINDQIKIHFDPDHLSVILRNLLHNAIKFSNPGSKIELISSVRSGDEVILEIIDEGMGMSPDQIDRVLHNFKAESSLGTLKEPGTGLGLIITKEFLQENGGALELESSPGKGSIFRLRLPLHSSSPSGNQANKPSKTLPT